MQQRKADLDGKTQSGPGWRPSQSGLQDLMNGRIEKGEMIVVDGAVFVLTMVNSFLGSGGQVLAETRTGQLGDRVAREWSGVLP
jgi:hypothetical protein